MPISLSASNVLHELEATLTELEQLTQKPVMTSRDEKRHAFLISKVAILRDHAKGTSLSELKSYEKDRLLREAGLPRAPEAPRSRMEQDIEQEYRDWLSGKPVRTANIPPDREVRFNQAGQESILATQGPAGGFLVPTGFWDRWQMVNKKYDDLFDPWTHTALETETGSQCPLPIIDDTANASTIIGETRQSSEVDIANFAQVQLAAFTFRSGYVPISAELITDSSFPLGPVVDKIVFERHARGVGKFLTTGNGVGQPTGLLTAIVAAGVSPIIASGSSANDGGAETGSTSIGTQDLTKCFFNINERYRRNALWYMSDSTLQSLTLLLDKMGHPLIEIVRGTSPVGEPLVQYFLLGRRIAICPSVPSIASASNPIIFGDPGYFVVRSVPSSLYLRSFREFGITGPPFQYADLVAFESYVRYDSNALIPNSQQSPFSFIQCHS